MILKEIEHVGTQRVSLLPLLRDVHSRLTTFGNGTQTVVHTYLIIQIIEVSLLDVGGISLRIVNLGNKNNFGMLRLHLRDSPTPELNRNHLCHVATETVDALRCPVLKDVEHHLPGARYWIEVRSTIVKIIDTIVEFNGLIPIVTCGLSSKLVVTRGASRHFMIVLLVDSLYAKFLTRDVIEIVLRREGE